MARYTRPGLTDVERKVRYFRRVNTILRKGGGWRCGVDHLTVDRAAEHLVMAARWAWHHARKANPELYGAEVQS